MIDLILLSLLTLALSGTTDAIERSLKSEGRVIYDEMSICHKSIQNYGNGQCAIPIINKLEELNKADKTLDFVVAEVYRKCGGGYQGCEPIIETVGHTEEEYNEMTETILLAYTCIKSTEYQVDDLMLCQQFK
tara:strand:- start:590 stop:988 length:399 start_codon:yes stop_codon:yes gene_type:complete